ncbi:streptogrisin C [Actinoalloteichus hoggarensis]|uniref:Alpha-lytic protease n=1 Tax=Actinoalloteichus hoggarensis TaxID=1470176 RepID=A0A221VX53_9PSEU|nr:S1 family peptidase [Actinoalloteichus hoggarensis]ASO18047.1 Alpha-lytic protease precursor [Actinoalloteichus hoggarensis]MBB5921401.1 streptogrisin C [Actinoalloteichus hoggarensis]
MRSLHRLLIALTALALLLGGAPNALAETTESAVTTPPTETAQLVPIAGGTLVTVGTPGVPCRVSFTVTGGFLAPPNCGQPPAVVRVGSTVVGSIAHSSATFSYATTLPNVTLQGWVINPGTGNIPITGSVETPVGGQVCRVGYTTGMMCGTLQAKNQSVSHPGGTLHGLTRTNICPDPGGTAAAQFFSGSQAQGIPVGGSGNCSSGGTTFFQPVNPILSSFGLSLVTS